MLFFMYLQLVLLLTALFISTGIPTTFAYTGNWEARKLPLYRPVLRQPAIDKYLNFLESGIIDKDDDEDEDEPDTEEESSKEETEELLLNPEAGKNVAPVANVVQGQPQVQQQNIPNPLINEGVQEPAPIQNKETQQNVGNTNFGDVVGPAQVQDNPVVNPAQENIPNANSGNSKTGGGILSSLVGGGGSALKVIGGQALSSMGLGAAANVMGLGPNANINRNAQGRSSLNKNNLPLRQNNNPYNKYGNTGNQKGQIKKKKGEGPNVLVIVAIVGGVGALIAVGAFFCFFKMRSPNFDAHQAMPMR